MPHSNSIPLVPSVGSRDEQIAAGIFDRPIGQLLCLSRGLRPADVDQILDYQQRHGGRFGEVAIALGLATRDDILEVLARQFDYPYMRSLDDSTIDADELVCARDPLGEDAQTFRELRSELLEGVMAGPTPPALAVLGPQSGDGRSYIAANLAIAFAQLGGRTLLIDADMRTSRQHTLFGIHNAAGLSQLLCGRTVQDVVQQAPRIAGLFLIGAGPIPPNPIELVHRTVFSELLREWLVKFDYVILDTPAASSGPDGRIVAAVAGAALVVARPHSTRMAQLERLVTAVEKGPATLAGVVINEH
jgi:chain length determinant protein tyrosine kinase EpsG